MSSESDLESSTATLPLHDSEHVAKHRKGHRKSIMQASVNESVKLKQARLKAFRDAQRGRIDGRHQYMIGLVADRLALDAAIVTDFMLDGDQVYLVL